MIEIRTPEEFDNIRNNLTAEYILMNDIDLSGINWIPVEGFAGTIDGNGYSIINFNSTQQATDRGNCAMFNLPLPTFLLKNITMVDPVTGTHDMDRVGIFIAEVNNDSFSENSAPVFENCNIIEGTINANSYAAGFCAYGYTNSQTPMLVNNCTVNGFQAAADYSSPFLGYFSCSAEISNCKIDAITLEANYSAGGYIAYSSIYNQEIKVKDCQFENIIINGTQSQYVGGIVGNMRGSICIENCQGDITVQSGYYHTGGLVGYISGGAIIKNCYVDTKIYSGYSNVGGLVGYYYGRSDIVNVIENCTATVNISGGTYYTGGLLGYVSGSDIEINNCKVSGSIGASYYSGGVAGMSSGVNYTNCQADIIINGINNYVGGFLGYAYGGSIRKCSAKLEMNVDEQENTYSNLGGFVGSGSSINIEESSVTGGVEGNSENAGGFVGYVYDGTIKNCYSITSTKGGDKSGGFVGYGRGTINIENCYTVNNLSGSATIGDFVGLFEGTSIDVVSCYYNQDISNYGDVYASGKSTEKMKDAETYKNWDFETIWGISSKYNEGYPILEVVEQEIEWPHILYFLEEPIVSIEPPSANMVTVTSPTAEYTAKKENISDDEIIERLVEINEGDLTVCTIVAEELLSRWGKEQKSVTGPVWLCMGLEFKKKAKVYIGEALIYEDMNIQKLEHDIIDQTTTVTAGDIILNDEELLARILDKL